VTEHPVSDEIRESILSVLKHRLETHGRNRGVVNVKPGNKPGEIVYVSPEMNTSCMASEDNDYFYFDWPSGRRRRAQKDKFLSERASKLARGA